MQHFIVHLVRGAEWPTISQLVQGLRGKSGLSISYDSYSKAYLLSVWDEATAEVVKLLKEQVEDAGGTFKVAA